jgi:hypothetical protein
MQQLRGKGTTRLVGASQHDRRERQSGIEGEPARLTRATSEGTVLPNFYKSIRYPAIDACGSVTAQQWSNTVQAITSRSMDQAQRLHDIADQVWAERKRTPRDTPLWETLNELATMLHKAAETAKETQIPMALSTSLKSVLRPS